MKKNLEAFYSDLGARESGGNYNIINKWGYVGKYQMGEAALVDAGYYKKNNKIYNNDWSGTFTGKDGVYSLNDFRTNKQAQENAQKIYKTKQWGYLKASGADKYLGQKINNIPITQSGLLAAAHLKGTASVMKYLKSGGKENPKDGLGTGVEEYLKRFSGYDVSSITGLNSDSVERFEGSNSNLSQKSSSEQATVVLKGGVNIQVDKNGTRFFTPEEIGEMSPQEFKKNLPIIEAQLEEKYLKKKLDSETRPKHKSSRSPNEQGHWITTKQGNKVFIEDSQIDDLKWYYPELEDIPKEDEEREELNSNSKEVDKNPPLSIMQKGLQMEENPNNEYWYLPNIPLTKVGVFPYYGQQISPNLEPDKLYMVYRPAEEIASEEALKTLELLPVIEDHAMLGTRPGMIPPEEKGIQGITGTNVHYEDGVVYGDVKIFTEYLKNVINSGKHEISMGYFCDYDYSSGYYNGQRYDVIQRNLRGNHIAIVDKGRMGEDVCIPMMLNLGTYDGINSEILLYDETVVYSSEVQSSYRSLEEQWQAYLRGE